MRLALIKQQGARVALYPLTACGGVVAPRDVAYLGLATTSRLDRNPRLGRRPSAGKWRGKPGGESGPQATSPGRVTPGRSFAGESRLHALLGITPTSQRGGFLGETDG